MTTSRNFHTLYRESEFVPNYKTYVSYTIIFYVWVLLEGIFRKWLFPGASSALFLVKFGIWGIVTLYFILDGKKISFRTYPFAGITFFYVFYGLLSVLVASFNYNLIVGLLGVMIHFTFISIAFILPIVIRTRQQIDKIFEILTYLIIFTASVSIIQYYSPFDSFINRYATEEEALVATVDEYARVTSIFSYISSHTTFLNYVLLFIFVKFFFIDRLNVKVIILIFSFGLGIVSALMTGSRGLTSFLGLECSLIALVTSFTTTSGSKFVIYISRIIFMGVALFLLITETSIGTQAFSSLNKRFTESGDTEVRIFDALTPFKYFDNAGWVGYGIGTTYQGAAAMVSDWKDMPRGFEEEQERLLLELGLIGYLIVLALRLSICVFAFRVYLLIKERYLKMLTLACFLLTLLPLFSFGSLIINWMDSILYWSVVGLLVAFRNIAQKQDLAPNPLVVY
ncbi:MAG: hypothetical protein H7Y04_03525 [Verrucomicrobia bacterium]|nr:hypothetical protein [Cytophagales bacterium]